MMSVEFFAEKAAALLHDPTFKPLNFSSKIKEKLDKLLPEVKAIKDEEGVDFHEALAKYVVDRLVALLKPKKKDFAEKLQEIYSKAWKDKTHYIEVADKLAASTDRLIIDSFYKQAADRVVYSNIINPEFWLDLDELAEGLKKDTVNDFIKMLSTVLSNVEEGYEYHALWRLLLPLTVKALRERLGDEASKASLLPADTRAPHLSIYDHLSATAAFLPLAEDGSASFIYWEVQGVQRFISESRALRDMWASSYMLSLLSFKALLLIAEEFGPDSVLRPSLFGLPLFDLWLYARGTFREIAEKLPFKRLITVPLVPAEGLIVIPKAKSEECIQRIKEVHKELWSFIADKVEQEIRRVSGDKCVAKLSEKIAELCGIEYSWNSLWELFRSEVPFEVAVSELTMPLDLTERTEVLKKFGISNEELEKLGKMHELSGYKIRFFEFSDFIKLLRFGLKSSTRAPKLLVPSQLLEGSWSLRDRRALCSMCWKRPAVLHGDVLQECKVELPVREDERLCSVCSVKRLLPMVLDDVLANVIVISKERMKEILGGIEHVFPSTSSISSLSLKLTTIRLAEVLGKESDLFKSLVSFISKVIALVKLGVFAKHEAYEPIYPYEQHEILRAKFRGEEPFSTFIELSGEMLMEETFLRKCAELEMRLQSEAEEAAKQGIESKIINLKQAVEDLKKLIANVEKQAKSQMQDFTVVRRPGKYYFAIRADGDDMGKFLFAEERFSRKLKAEKIVPKPLRNYLHKDADKEARELNYMPGPSYFAMMSRAISTLSRLVAEKCYEIGIALVYTGGDDLLAMSPPEIAFKFAAISRALFSSDVLQTEDPLCGAYLAPGLGSMASQSYSLIASHCYDPMHATMEELSASLDKVAKKMKTIIDDKKFQKDAATLTYKPRGGSPLKCVLSWSLGGVTAGKARPSSSFAANIGLLLERMISMLSLTFDEPKVFSYRVKEEFDKLGFRMLECISTESKKAFLTKRGLGTAYTAFRVEGAEIKDPEVIESLLKEWIRRHTFEKEKGAAEALVANIVDWLRNYAYVKLKVKGEKEERVMLIELLKGAAALLTAMDSDPTRMGRLL